MYGILIVDDEKYVRLWLINCIDWEKLGFFIVGEAINGSDAMEKITELKPRVVITDMDMPEVDGVGLVSEASRVCTEILFVILSGFKEFEYMQSAVRYNAVDYLLKPVKSDEIIRVFKNLKIRLEDEDEKSEEKKRAKMLYGENIELKREKFFLELLEEKALISAEAAEKADKLEVKKAGDLFCVLVIRFSEEIITGNCYPHVDIEFEKTQIIDTISVQFSEIDMIVHHIVRKNEIIGIVNLCKEFQDAYQKIINTLMQILSNLNASFDLMWYIGLGSIVDDIMCLGTSYMQAKKSLELRLVFRSSRLFTFQNVPGNLAGFKLSTIDENEFSNSITTGQFERCKEVVARIFKRIIESKDLNVETVKTIYYRMMSIILKAANDSGIPMSSITTDDIGMFSAIENIDSIYKMHETVLEYSRKVTDIVSKSESIKRFAVEKAKEYIVNNIRNEITLKSIGEHVHITPNYFCTLFKQETGQSIFDYIISMRVEIAKSYMAQESLHIYEISELAGYRDIKYFSRAFKKIVGISPSSYREKLLGK